MASASYVLHVGDTRQVLATMEPGSVQCVVTSPPYLAKRAYLPADHPDKPLEMGQEPTPADFLAGALVVMDALWDVLADDGVAFINYGDTASGSGGAGGDYTAGGLREGQQAYSGSARKRARLGVGDDYRPARTRRMSPKTAWRLNDDGTVKHTTADLLEDPKNVGQVVPAAGGPGWPRNKSICWIPELFGASLAYGRNLLTGDPCRQWVTRPSMTWCKPNPSVGAIFDKFREATELVVMATKQGAYWFDLDPVRKPHQRSPESLSLHHGEQGPPERNMNHGRPFANTGNEKGAPPLNWQDDPGTLPAAYVQTPAQYPGAHYAVMPPALARLLITVGCPPDGTVLDPFVGSGTTLAEAFGLGRSAVGIDLDVRNVPLVQERFGMFPVAIVDHLGDQAPASRNQPRYHRSRWPAPDARPSSTPR